MKVFRSRVVAVGVGAVVLVSLGGISGAVAAKKITSNDIQNQTIRSVDISNSGVGKAELRKGAVAKGEVRSGAVGSAELQDGSVRLTDLQGKVEDKVKSSGAIGNYHIEAPSPKFQVEDGLQKNTITCDKGDYAIGGGYRIRGSDADKRAIQVTGSFADGLEVIQDPDNKYNEATATGWSVEGFNTGDSAVVVQPFAVCATVNPKSEWDYGE